jgi:polysaccharide export outer membrane protein
MEMLASVGGVQPNASRRIKVTRRAEFGKIPLPNAVVDAASNTSSVEIGLGSLRENVNPAEDIVLRPFDVISVERAEMIYVNGEVGKVGPLELGERDSMSMLQVLSLAGGLTKTANPKKAWILRPQPNTAKRTEIPIDLDKVLKGKVEDFALLPNDVLYVPRSSKAKETIETTASYLLLPLASTLLYLLLIR